MTAPPRHLVLVGLMGAGKTTVGKLCAARLGRDFVDTDDVVLRLAGMPFPELFETLGESGFRKIEKEAVRDVCASPAPLVIATGGGAVIDAENRRTLSGAGYVVWLRAPVAVLSERVGDGADRPLLAGGPEASLARLLSRREPAYEAASDFAVDTEARGPNDVADAVLDAFCGAAR